LFKKYTSLEFLSNNFFVIIILAVIFAAYLASALYHGSFVSTCTFTEREVPLPSLIKNSKIKLIKEASIVTGREPEMECLDILGKVTNEFIEVVDENYSRYKDPNRKVTRVSPIQNLTFTPYKMVWYKTRGLRWALGSSSTIYILLLKNNQNEIIEIPLVSLGINKGDEFLKAVNGSDEYILNYEFFKQFKNLEID
jgi:hypothetical protein